MSESTLTLTESDADFKVLKSAVLQITHSNNYVINYLLTQNSKLKEESVKSQERIDVLEKVTNKLYEALTTLEREYTRTTEYLRNHVVTSCIITDENAAEEDGKADDQVNAIINTQKIVR